MLGMYCRTFAFSMDTQSNEFPMIGGKLINGLQMTRNRRKALVVTLYMGPQLPRGRQHTEVRL